MRIRENDSGSVLGRSRPADVLARNRPRRAGLLAFAALMIVGSALVGAVVFTSGTQDVVAVRDPVTAGQPIERDNLITTSVSGVEGAIETSSVESVIGGHAAVDMVAGQIVTEQMVTDDPAPGRGEAGVGLLLDMSQMPSAGLLAGDVVDVIAIPGGDNAATNEDALDAPTILARSAKVQAVTDERSEGTRWAVSLIVDSEDAARVAAYSASGRVAVVQTSFVEDAGE